MKRKHAFGAVVLVGMFVALFSGIAASSLLGGARTPQQSEQRPDPSVFRRQQAAEREGGLAAAAAITGSYVKTTQESTVGSPAYLEELIDSADAIVVGWVDDNICKLSRDGRSIETYVTVRVETALKGAMGGRSVVVVTPGGKASFPDGTWAQINTPGFMPLINNRRYLLFLQTAADKFTIGREAELRGGAAYVTASGPLGAYDVTGVSHVRPNGGYQTKLGLDIWRSKISGDGFVLQIRDLVRSRGSK